MATPSESVEAKLPTELTDQVVSFLRNRESYGEPTTRVEQLETHISWLFLTDDFVYKLKKPVTFDFLDFGSLSSRHTACEEEVRCNRRLAPGVYVGVIPITLESLGQLELGGGGRVVDWVVKMRRLPAERTLDHLILSGKLRSEEIDALSRRLVGFYKTTPPLAVSSEWYLGQLDGHVRANYKELTRPEHGLDVATVTRVHAAQLRVLEIQRSLFESRVSEGRIVDGHGDLRPEHVYLVDEPIVIDGIEFNPALRHLDVLDELCFLAMECEALQAPAVGKRIISAYCDASNDRPPIKLLSFYQSYRACVRAKVSSLRAVQMVPASRSRSRDHARQYIELADQFAKALGPPLCLVVWGLSGSGKSILARELSERLMAELIQTDALRKELFASSDREWAFGEGPYRVEHRNQVYDAVLRRAIAILVAGRSVVLDGTYLAAEQRAKAMAMANWHHAQPLFVYCECPREVAEGRVRARLATGSRVSEFHPALIDRQRQLAEWDTGSLPACHVDTTKPLPVMVQGVIAELARLENASGS